VAESSLKFRVPLYHLGHGVVVQLMGKNDSADLRELHQCCDFLNRSALQNMPSKKELLTVLNVPEVALLTKY